MLIEVHELKIYQSMYIDNYSMNIDQEKKLKDTSDKLRKLSSNFRFYMILCITKVLAAIVSLSHDDFLACWCSSNLLDTEEDSSIEYDIFVAVRWIMDNTSPGVRSTTNFELNLIPNSMPKVSYAHHKT